MKLSGSSSKSHRKPFTPSRAALFAVWFTCLASWVAFSSTIQAATIQFGSTKVTGVNVAVPLVADVGSAPMGRYEVFIAYDTNLLQFVSFTKADTNFAEPVVNATTPGQIRANANNIQSMNLPTGVVQVAVITFQSTGGPGTNSNLSFTSAKLFTTVHALTLQTTAINGSISATVDANAKSKPSRVIQPSTTIVP